MTLEILGHPLFEKDDQGRLKSRIATIFLDNRTLVTLPGIHATQRMAFQESVDADRKSRNLPPLSLKERDALLLNCVDLVLLDHLILIRPDPQKIGLMFQADELLQGIASKRRIRFLGIQNQTVYQTIKQRGECWRITPTPKSTDEAKQLIESSWIRIGGREIYRYNATTGTRWLTCEQFAELKSLDDEALRAQLVEIQQFAASVNSRRHWEVDFFPGGVFRSEVLHRDFHELDAPALRETHRRLAQTFHDEVPPELRRDDAENVTWRKQMVDALTPEEEYLLWEEDRLGLSPEFHMHIQWLPGGRIVDGALLFDSVFSESAQKQGGKSVPSVCDDTIRSLVFNYVRDRGNLEYINVGRVVERLSLRDAAPGRRDVYVVEMKEQDRSTETVKIIRMQKWDVRERLNEGTTLLDALIQTEVYTEYIRDRGLGCRQLGMNIAGRVATGKICEVYGGRQRNLCGIRYWTPYFERNYIRGVATDKIPPAEFEKTEYAAKFASLLGRAAAANMIVGRCTLNGDVLFDDGDEVLILDEHDMPTDLVVVDYTGAFAGFEQELHEFAAAYARPINTHIIHVENRTEFVENYLAALLTRFREIRDTYREQRAAYDLLFGHRPETEHGCIAYRWKCVLQRLDTTDLAQLERQLRTHLPAQVRPVSQRCEAVS